MFRSDRSHSTGKRSETRAPDAASPGTDIAGNRRSATRRNAPFVRASLRASNETDEVSVKIMNISEAGALFFCARSFDMHISVVFSARQNEVSLTTAAKVVRCDGVAASVFLVAVAFDAPLDVARLPIHD